VARIRTVKPEFWSDGDMLAMSDSCALFFIGLWNYVDDEGKHPVNYRQLAAELGGRWHQGKVKLFVSCLVKSGQLRLNSDSTWLQVTGWSHQKIDKPRQPDVKAEDLTWLSHSDSTIALEASSSIRRKDRIGKDSIGLDRMSPTGVQTPAVAAVAVSPNKPNCSETWKAYSSAYESRYCAAPVRNASVNAKIAQFVRRVGEAEAPDIAAFYVWHNEAFYVRSGHPVGLLLKDAESLRTQWATGKRVTAAAAYQADRTQNNAGVFESLIAEAKRREASNG